MEKTTKVQEILKLLNELSEELQVGNMPFYMEHPETKEVFVYAKEPFYDDFIKRLKSVGIGN